MAKIKVLCGGISPESEVSKVSGKFVFEALKKFFDTELITLEKNELPDNIDSKSCVVFPAMHGDYGEDGTLQMQLDKRGISYAGCGSLSSRTCMVKPASKSLMKFAGLPVADAIEFQASEKVNAEAISKIFPNGAVIKPADKGSSVGLNITKSESETKEVIEKITEGFWLVEEYVKGREFSIGVIDGKAAGLVEIIPDGGVYDFKRKYTAGSTKYEFPAKVSFKTLKNIEQAAEKAFEICGCRDFARVDFILKDDETSDFIILEINTLPGMTPTSLLPKSASCIGYDFDSLCKKMVENAIKRLEV